MPAVYTPILKAKEGEFAAVQALDAGVRDALIPLFEVPSVPHDYATDSPMRSIDEHLKNLGSRLANCWPGERALYLDMPSFRGADATMSDGTTCVARALADCIENGVRVVPVVSRTCSAQYLRAVKEHHQEHSTGACLRLSSLDFDDDVVDPETAIGGLLTKLSIAPHQADVILDLRSIGSEESRDFIVARWMLAGLPDRDAWARIVVAGSSFPEDLSEVVAASFTTIQRSEWHLWRSLRRKPQHLPAQLVFGDYAVAHPVIKELDPRVMRMSASIRYTTADAWLIAKGRNVRQYGFDQYFELCRELVERPEYSGEAFSWGDGFIAACARGDAGPGNATTWRKVGTNHHITMIVNQVAKPGGS